MPLQPDVSDLTADVALGATPFTIFRYQYNWVGGEYIRSGEQRISAVGIVRPHTSGNGAMETYAYSPDGYVEEYTIKITTKAKLLIRDTILWNDQRFIVSEARRWDAYGFCDVVCKYLGEHTSLETGGDADA